MHSIWRVFGLYLIIFVALCEQNGFSICVTCFSDHNGIYMTAGAGLLFFYFCLSRSRLLVLVYIFCQFSDLDCGLGGGRVCYYTTTGFLESTLVSTDRIIFENEQKYPFLEIRLVSGVLSHFGLSESAFLFCLFILSGARVNWSEYGARLFGESVDGLFSFLGVLVLVRLRLHGCLCLLSVTILSYLWQEGGLGCTLELDDCHFLHIYFFFFPFLLWGKPESRGAEILGNKIPRCLLWFFDLFPRSMTTSLFDLICDLGA